MRELLPIRRDHVRSSRQARGAPEFCHHFAPGVAVFGTARILGISEHAVFVTTETDGFRERPSPIGIESDPRRRKAFVQSDDRLHLGLAREDTALELEIIETVAASRRIREEQDRLWSQRIVVT